MTKQPPIIWVTLILCGWTSSPILAQTLIPQMGDLNCDGNANVVDVQMAILSALGQDINPALDENGDGTPDGCNDYASAISGNCQVGELIKWNGTVWECATDEVSPGVAGPQGEPGDSGNDGWNSLVEITPEAPGCAQGGVTVYAGLDLDGNGALGSAEATSTVEVCHGTTGAQGLPGAPADPTVIEELQEKVTALEQQLQDMKGDIAPPNTLATADLSGCQEGDGLVKTSAGWACQPQSAGELATLTKYTLNSACKISNYETATWTWGELYPDAEAAGEDLSQCILINQVEATFRWNQNANECTGAGGTYTVYMGDVAPDSEWAHQAASTAGKIGGIQAASYVESAGILACWK